MRSINGRKFIRGRLASPPLAGTLPCENGALGHEGD
jgi:hypothetical protein